MKKIKIIYALICALALLLLSNCGWNAQTNDDGYIENDYNNFDESEYEQKKAECFQYMIDNEELLDSIVRQLENYDANMDFYCVNNSIELYGNADNGQREQILSDEMLIGDLLRFFENENIDCISKVKFKNNTYSSYIVSFTDIRKGYFCCAYLADNPDDNPDYDEHIVGNWYYSVEQGE